MAVSSMYLFGVWSMLLAVVGSAQGQRPDTGFVFPEINVKGQSCTTPNGAPGSCIQLAVCRNGVDYRRGIVPQLCYWENSRPIVCCPRNDNTKDGGAPIATSETSCGQSATQQNASRVPQIAGGWLSLPSAWPWMISIHRSNFGVETFLCGGTIISNKYILTAGHCFGRNGNDQQRIPLSRFIIRVGNNANNEGTSHRIKDIIIHENYRVGQHYNDIALIEVNQQISFSRTVKSICLPSSELQGRRLVGNEVVVIGWGDQSFGGIRDRKLREVNISVIDREQCDTAYATLSSRAIPRGVTSQFVCAGDLAGGKDACQADSGGPLMLNSSSRWTIVGIVSFGYGCAQRGFPGVYTQVASYLNWIKDNTDI